jgi:hypothetical protein
MAPSVCFLAPSWRGNKKLWPSESSFLATGLVCSLLSGPTSVCPSEFLWQSNPASVTGLCSPGSDCQPSRSFLLPFHFGGHAGLTQARSHCLPQLCFLFEAILHAKEQDTWTLRRLSSPLELVLDTRGHSSTSGGLEWYPQCP